MQTPLVSIIIPTYNRAHLIGETLGSILAQTYTNWECIVVDDDSTDETTILVDVFCKNDLRIKYFHRSKKKPKGANACRNYGMVQAKGNYIIFLDSDDLLKTTCLEKRVNCFSEHKNADFLVFQSELFLNTPGDLKKIPNILTKNTDDLSRFISGDYPWQTTSALINKKRLESLNIVWDENLACHQDLDFYIHILSFTNNYIKVEIEPDFYLRMGEENKISNQSFTASHLKSKLLYLQNIKKYLLEQNMFSVTMKYRLYGLSLNMGHFFLKHQKIELLKEVAILNEVSNNKLLADIKYLNIGSGNSLRVLLRGTFYKLKGLPKRLQFADFSQSTLAKYKVKQEPYWNLNVVHITTSLSGGAGIAAYRIHDGLLEQGVPSKMLTLNPFSISKNEVFLFKKPKLTFIKKIKRKILREKPLQQRQAEMLQSKKGSFEIYSFPETDYKIHEHPLIKEAAIIHLHWVAGFVDYPSFFKQIKKPIIWTLHDMNPFQGGFHYKEDENRNIENFKNFEKKIIKIKKRSYKKAFIKLIVSPSKWLKETSENSKLLGNFKHVQIYNGVDEKLFKIRDQKQSRAHFQLPLDKQIILFVSETLENKRKGFHMVSEISKNFKSNSTILFVAIGKIPKMKLTNVRYLGNINEEEELAKLYSAADVFVLPSSEDNLPNVMLEALMCGTPVIASPVGGMLEVIKDGFNGYLTKEVSEEAFTNAFQLFFENSKLFSRELIRNNAIKHYSINKQVNKYIKLYKTIIN